MGFGELQQQGSRGESWAVSVSQPPDVILKILIIQWKEGLIESIEAYNRVKGKGITAEIYEIRARLLALVLDVEPSFQPYYDQKQKLEKSSKTYEDMLKLLYTTDKYDDLLQIFRAVNYFLYEKGVTKFDTKLKYDKTRVEDANTARGMS